MAGIGRPLMDDSDHVSAGTLDFSKFRNITSLPTTRLIPRASILTLQQQQQSLQQHYRTNLKIDIEHGASGQNDHHQEGHHNSHSTSNSSSGLVGGYEKLSSLSGNGGVSLLSSVIGGGNGTSSSVGVSRLDLTSSAYEHVDKSIKLSLEPKNNLDPLANAYVSVKNGRGDQKSEMIIVTPSNVAQGHGDREMVIIDIVPFCYSFTNPFPIPSSPLISTGPVPR